MNLSAHMPNMRSIHLEIAMEHRFACHSSDATAEELMGDCWQRGLLQFRECDSLQQISVVISDHDFTTHFSKCTNPARYSQLERWSRRTPPEQRILIQQVREMISSPRDKEDAPRRQSNEQDTERRKRVKKEEGVQGPRRSKRIQARKA